MHEVLRKGIEGNAFHSVATLAACTLCHIEVNRETSHCSTSKDESGRNELARVREVAGEDSETATVGILRSTLFCSAENVASAQKLSHTKTPSGLPGRTNRP